MAEGWNTGDDAPEDRFLVYGYYETITDGVETAVVERPYDDAPRIASELGDGERGVLLVARAARVSAAVAKQLAG